MHVNSGAFVHAVLGCNVKHKNLNKKQDFFLTEFILICQVASLLRSLQSVQFYHLKTKQAPIVKNCLTTI